MASLLDKNASLEGEGNEYAPENEERLFGVPIRMLLDINQQVHVYIVVRSVASDKCFV